MSSDSLPACGQDVYSLERFSHAFRAGHLPRQFQIGGRLIVENSECMLVAACGRLAIPLDCQKTAGHGDIILLTILKENVALLNQNHDRLFQINKIEDLRVLYRATNFNKSDGIQENEATRWHWPIANEWSRFLHTIREFFYKQKFLEINTPTLVPNPGMEPELEPFSTQWRIGSQRKTLFLHTSPELHLKPLLVQGYSDIFEMKSVFRNEELTSRHEPEFILLEWYRAFANLENIIEDLTHLLLELGVALSGPLRRMTVAEVFARDVDFLLTPSTSRDELFNLAQRLNLSPDASLDWNDLFHLIWVARIETTLPSEPFLLTKYPPSQAALARLDQEGWADRFEFYWRGIEIANAFHELNDPDEQRKRFEKDRNKRREYGRTALEVDSRFLQSLEQGMPPSAGIALGVERLFMALKGMEQISPVRPYSYRREL